MCDKLYLCDWFAKIPALTQLKKVLHSYRSNRYNPDDLCRLAKRKAELVHEDATGLDREFIGWSFHALVRQQLQNLGYRVTVMEPEFGDLLQNLNTI